MRIDPPDPTPEPSEPLGYRSTADDRAARKKVSFPTLVKRTLLIVGPLAVVFVLLLPSRGLPRESAQRIKCASTLRQIAQACYVFANDNNGQYPVSLSLAFADSKLPIDLAFCPSHWREVPTTLPSHLLDAHSDYLYLAAGLTISAPPDIILAYERPGSHAANGVNLPEGVNVLFSDGRVEFLSLPGLQKALESSHTQRQLWERRPKPTPP